MSATDWLVVAGACLVGSALGFGIAEAGAAFAKRRQRVSVRFDIGDGNPAAMSDELRRVVAEARKASDAKAGG